MTCVFSVFFFFVYFLKELFKKAKRIIGLPRWLSGKKIACQCGECKVGKIPWRRKWQLTPLFLPGKFHGQSSLVGYSPWGRRVTQDRRTEHTHTHTHTHTKNNNMPTFLNTAQLKRVNFTNRVQNPIYSSFSRTSPLHPMSELNTILNFMCFLPLHCFIPLLYTQVSLSNV